MSKPLLSIIIGLGNHAMLKTKHSIGMVVCDELALMYNASWEYSRKYKAHTASIEALNDKRFVLIKSTLPMNINGKSLLKAVKDLNVSHDSVVLLHDDLDRHLGKISWKSHGSAGGHNGVKSVIASLRNHKIKRLRIGIGRPTNKDQVSEYVLGEFSKEDHHHVESAVKQAVQLIDNHLIYTEEDKKKERKEEEEEKQKQYKENQRMENENKENQDTVNQDTVNQDTVNQDTVNQDKQDQDKQDQDKQDQDKQDQDKENQDKDNAHKENQDNVHEHKENHDKDKDT